MQYFKELKPISREWFVGCLVIVLDNDRYVYVNRGRQVQSLQKDTFELVKPDLEPVSQEEAIKLVPELTKFLADPSVMVPFPLRC